ncbi:Uncharacterised protein [uncultured archaeon]|nr:Uncharacterised protein [uncultured archaeon]
MPFDRRFAPEKWARIHFIPDLKVGVFVTLRAPDVIKNGTGQPQIFLISLSRSKRVLSLPTESELESGAKMGASRVQGAINIEAATGPIDGTIGAILSMDCPVAEDHYIKVYDLIYYPKSDQEHTIASIVSTYPWDRTLELLKTFHIQVTG